MSSFPLLIITNYRENIKSPEHKIVIFYFQNIKLIDFKFQGLKDLSCFAEAENFMFQFNPQNSHRRLPGFNPNQNPRVNCTSFFTALRLATGES